MGRYEEAKALIERAVELAPDDPGTLRTLASIYVVLGDAKKALEYVNMAEALGEGEYNADFWLTKGDVLAAMGRTREAIECYERGLALAGDDELMIRILKESIEKLKKGK